MVVAPPSESLEIWQAIRQSTSYTEIIDLSNEWLPSIWDHTRALHIAPRGKKIFNNCPRISAATNMDPINAALYFCHEPHRGSYIKIGSLMRMRGFDKPMFVTLRETILHEVQHSIDDRYNVYSVNHGHWFERRLARLINLFPIEQ